MSYQVLARKWRPHSFAEIVGQQHIVRALSHALDQNRLHHALLFTGTRGVGKTTLARLFAKALNCEQGVSANPCSQCSACTELDQGRFVDLIEIDAASRTKVEDTRELLDNVQYAPTRGRYKVYLIDEVHMLSNHSFNALLKTLEEPPPHVKFILATTDPQKLPITVLSRCLQFNLQQLPEHLIAERLSTILSTEDISFEPLAVRLIAQAGQGSMRDALTLLDQAIAYGNGDINSTDINAMLGTIDRQFILLILEAIVAQNTTRLWQVLADLHQAAPDYDAVLAELLSTLQQIAVLQVVPSAKDEQKALKPLAEQFSPEDIQLYYQFALLGRRDLSWAAQPRSGFEMVLLRMLSFRLEAQMTPASQPQPTKSLTDAPKPVKPKEESHSGRAMLANIQRELKAGIKEPQKQPLHLVGSNKPTLLPETNVTQLEVPTPAELQNWPQRWPDIVDQLAIQGMARQLAKHSVIQSLQGHKIVLALAAGHRSLRTEQALNRLNRALNNYAACSLKLSVVLQDFDTQTPAQADQQQQTERLELAEQSIKDDPNVQALQQAFDASIQPGSVRPLPKDTGTPDQ